MKSPKLVTKYQNDSKAEFTGSPSETQSDSDSTEGTESEDKVLASSVIRWLFIQVKAISSLWQAAKSIDYEISQEIFSFLHLSH